MFFYFKPGFSGYFSLEGSEELSEIKNPVIGLSDEEAIFQFNKDYVLYLLVSLGVQELHNTPLSSDTPKILVRVNDEVFSAEVRKGRVSLREREIDDEDIIIWTSREEVVKMLRDKNYIESSFVSGKSGFQLSSGKAELIAKGYLSLYNNL